MFLIFTLLFSLGQSELVYLGFKNYTMAKKEYQPLIVFYYGDDKQSKKFLDDFIAIATGSHSLQKTGTYPTNINFGLVNAVEEKKLIEKTQIQVTPSIFLFYADTQKQKYSGAFNAQAFLNWLKKTYRDSPELNEFYPSSLLQKWDQFVNKINSFQLIAFLATPEYRVSPLKAFVQAAKQIPQGYVFCHIFNPDLYQHLGLKKEESGLVIYSKLEDLEDISEEKTKKYQTYLYRFKGDVKNTDEILQFLKIYAFKKGFVYVDDTKFQKLSRRVDLLPSVILLYNKTNPEHEKYVQLMQDARYTLLNKAILGVLDVDGDCQERLERVYEINVNTTQLPQLIAMKPIDDNRFYKYKKGPLDPVQFYEQIQSGQIKPFYRDEGILQNLYDGAGIYKLTRSTYYPFIKEQNDKGIDVVVTFTAKKCQPCKDFRPDYNEVFKKHKQVIEGKVIFARCDIENNEIDDLHIDSYPHVKLYAAGKEHPSTLHQQKTEESLTQWLSEQSNYGNLFKVKTDL
ncbi:unnamed protein product [Paramecium sonneborni]|uniref:protein disulfide-isomerase n=1 Tax=Paramecium sonneborni TaxID=65129 RepID=A0A8S1LH20_9CILI|nr:unnamed protein product [Paramecium sonneborni]